MTLTTKSLLIAALAVVSALGLYSTLNSRSTSPEVEREQAVAEADQHVLDGTAPRQPQTAGTPKGPSNPQDISSQLVTLNADQYRQEITDLDRLVFADQPMTKERKEALAARLEALARRITSSSDSRFIALEASEIRQLAAIAGNLRPDAPRATLQTQWMRIRNNLFDDRSWFARSAADLEPEVGAPTPANSSTASSDRVKNATDPFVPAPGQGKQELEGRWRVKALVGNGRPATDPELANSLWMFDRNHLYIAGPTGSPSHYTFEKVSDDRGTALHLEPDPSNAGPAEAGWMNYEFAGGDLKLAFFDGLGERPESFTPPEGKRDPLFLMVVLQRER